MSETDRDRCKICDRRMAPEEDYGGDCVYCMAFVVEDPTAINHLKVKLDALWEETEDYDRWE